MVLTFGDAWLPVGLEVGGRPAARDGTQDLRVTEGALGVHQAGFSAVVLLTLRAGSLVVGLSCVECSAASLPSPTGHDHQNVS